MSTIPLPDASAPADQMAVPVGPVLSIFDPPYLGIDEFGQPVYVPIVYRNMLIGALWCVGGIVVTAVTYSAASGPGGGTYVVTWGAIVFGFIRFLGGLSLR